MVVLENNNRLTFRYFDMGEEHATLTLSMAFNRCQRLDNPGENFYFRHFCGTFPLFRVEDCAERLPQDWVRKGGLLLPMYDNEALQLSFEGRDDMAVKIALGHRCAVSGREWRDDLVRGERFLSTWEREAVQNYVCVPKQTGLGGYWVGLEQYRQMVLPSLLAQGEGERVMGAHRGSVELLIEVIPKDPDYDNESEEDCDVVLSSPPREFLSTGAFLRGDGEVVQIIDEDKNELDWYDFSRRERVIVHLVHAEDWPALTGEEAPGMVVDEMCGETKATTPHGSYFLRAFEALQSASITLITKP